MSEKNVTDSPAAPPVVACSDLLGGKRETPLLLPNDTKILFCNTMDAMLTHCSACKECERYIRWGDGDLCTDGKAIIAKELCYADTNLALPSNVRMSEGGRET